MTLATLPGINVLSKYHYRRVNENGTKMTIETSGIVPHFDKQKLFGFGWKQDVQVQNRFILDMLIVK